MWFTFAPEASERSSDSQSTQGDGYHRPWTNRPHLAPWVDMTDHESLRELGKRVREMRKQLGMTQEQLAHQAELDRSYVGGIERGERNITFSVLCQVARALAIDVGALTNGIPASDT
jgi:ribosome-binding protein aMBF1 (putative translation factor)